MAYWTIAHGTDHRRAMLSRPASWMDLTHALLWARGVDPAQAGQDPSDAPQGPQGPPTRPRGPGPTVKVHGGQATASHQRMAEHWHRANMPKDWAKRTGSDPAAIAWLLDPEA